MIPRSFPKITLVVAVLPILATTGIRAEPPATTPSFDVTLRVLGPVSGNPRKPVSGLDVVLCDRDVKHCIYSATTDRKGLARYSGVATQVVVPYFVGLECSQVGPRLDLSQLVLSQTVEIVLPPVSYVRFDIVDDPTAGPADEDSELPFEQFRRPTPGTRSEEGTIGPPSHIEGTVWKHNGHILSCLKPDVDYDISLKFPGYEPVALSALRVRLGETRAFKIQLKLLPKP